MKILQLCPRIPFPPVDGGTIGMYNLSNALVNHGAEVKVLAFNTSKHFIAEKNIDKGYIATHHLESVFLDNRVNIKDAFINLFTKESYHISRFKSVAFEAKLKAVLLKEKFDVVQLDYLPMALYIDLIRQHSDAKIVLRAHNVEHRIWERLADEEKNIFKQWYLRKLAVRLFEFEQSVLKKIDALVSLTEEETVIFQSLGYKGAVCIAPTCFNIDQDQSTNQEKEFSVFHLGAMDWMPNAVGMEWFIKNVWPMVTASHPHIKLYIAGNKMPDHFFSFQSENCIVQGRVNDAKQFMLDHTLMIVPLFAGSGIRVKIVEGMALGKTIISTTQGAEGLHCTHMENIIIANSADEMYKAILLCAEDKILHQRIGENARNLAVDYYDMNKVGGDVFTFYKSLLPE